MRRREETKTKAEVGERKRVERWKEVFIVSEKRERVARGKK